VTCEGQYGNILGICPLH